MNNHRRSMRSGRLRIAEVGDSDLFTGRELKALLRVMVGDAATRDRWLKLEEAAQRMGIMQPALRRRCMRWAAQEQPVVLVRKMSDADGSHWLLLESDVDKLCGNEQRPTSESAPQATDLATDNDQTTADALVDYWAERLSQDL